MTPAPPWGQAHPSGHHRPGIFFRVLLGLSRAVPQVPIVKQLAFLFRRIARSLEPDHVDVTHRGFRLRLRTRNNISETTFLFMPRRWDVPECAFLREHLPSDCVFVDVGCNAGGYVWFLLDELGHRADGRGTSLPVGPRGGLRVLAVEPDPELRRRLLFNLDTNGVEGVTVVGDAVGTREGKGWLRLDPGNRGENVLREAGENLSRERGANGAAEAVERYDGVSVRVRPLLEIVRDAGLTRIDGLKIDVEGLEAAVLLDFFDRVTASLRPGLLLVEWRDSEGHGALGRRLESLGYVRALRTRMNTGFVRA